MTRRPARRDEAGLTLIEVLVVMLLTAILSAGLYTMTVGQSRTYSGQLTSLNTQQNLWGAMEYLQRQLRAAGWGQADGSACPNGQLVMWSGSGNTTLPWNGGATAGFRGFNNCSLYDWEVVSTNAYPPPAGSCVDDTAGTNGVDSFAVAYSGNMGGVARLPSVTIADKMPSSSANLKVTECMATFGNNDILAIDPNCPPGDTNPCCKKCWVLQVTKDPSQCTATDCSICPAGCMDASGSCGCTKRQECLLQHRPNSTNNLNPPGGNNIFGKCQIPKGARVNNLSGAAAKIFRVALDKSTRRLYQWTQANGADREVIAEGIEDMQLSWACDRDGSGVLDEGATASAKTSDEWAYNVPSDTPPNCPSSPCATNCVDSSGNPVPWKAVRITLIGRAVSPELGNHTSYRPGAEDRAGGLPSDDMTATGNLGTYRRSRLTSTILLRNTR